MKKERVVDKIGEVSGFAAFLKERRNQVKDEGSGRLGRGDEGFRDGTGCGDQCTAEHYSDGNCLRCGEGWGSHNGHTCSGGTTRGSWVEQNTPSKANYKVVLSKA